MVDTPPSGGAGAPPAQPATPRPPAEAEAHLVELNALLGRGTRYAGKLFFEGRVRVEGGFTGDIRGDVLIIGDGADVDGDIEVEICIVTGGQIRANIRAFQAIELHAPAIVRGDLHAPNVFIDRGVQFEGNLKMQPLDGPADRKGDRRAQGDAALATRSPDTREPDEGVLPDGTSPDADHNRTG